MKKEREVALENIFSENEFLEISRKNSYGKFETSLSLENLYSFVACFTWLEIILNCPEIADIVAREIVYLKIRSLLVHLVFNF